MITGCLILTVEWCLFEAHTLQYASFLPAGPEPDLQPPAVRSGACQEHVNLHGRLDVVEKVPLPNRSHVGALHGLNQQRLFSPLVFHYLMSALSSLSVSSQG